MQELLSRLVGGIGTASVVYARLQPNINTLMPLQNLTGVSKQSKGMLRIRKYKVGNSVPNANPEMKMVAKDISSRMSFSKFVPEVFL